MSIVCAVDLPTAFTLSTLSFCAQTSCRSDLVRWWRGQGAVDRGHGDGEGREEECGRRALMVDGVVAGERSHVAGSQLQRGDELRRRDGRRPEDGRSKSRS